MKTFTDDISMKFGLHECVITVMKGGKQIKSQNMPIDDKTSIQSHDEDAACKYLGVDEDSGIQHSAMKEKIAKEYYHQGILSPRNIITKECYHQGILSPRNVITKEYYHQGMLSPRNVITKECYHQGILSQGASHSQIRIEFKNKSSAINPLSVPVSTFSFGILEWRKSEIEKMDRKTLKLVGSHIHHNHVLILALSAMTYQARILCLWTSSFVLTGYLRS